MVTALLPSLAEARQRALLDEATRRHRSAAAARPTAAESRPPVRPPDESPPRRRAGVRRLAVPRGVLRTVLGTLVVLAAALAALGGGRDGAAEEVYPLPDQKSEGAFSRICLEAGGTFSFGTTSITCTKGNNWVSCESDGGSATDCTTNVPPPQRAGSDAVGVEAGRGSVVGADPVPDGGGGRGCGGVGAAGATRPGAIDAIDDDPGTVVVPTGDPADGDLRGGLPHDDPGGPAITREADPAPEAAAGAAATGGGAAPADPVQDPAAHEAATPGADPTGA